MPLQLDREIRALIPNAWEAFFARFGRLTEVQRAAIPVILAGKDALVASGTASGKTEAVCAPLVERYLRPGSSACILYISPTRALINDLFRRLYAPLKALSLRLGRRTGEYRRLTAPPPHVLLTTPESLDSMLCRLPVDEQGGHPLAHVAAVVLDEVHLLYGTARGEQVRWLLERLRRLRQYGVRVGWNSRGEIQVVCLSATVADPDAIRSQFILQGEIVSAGSVRQIIRVGAERPKPVEQSLIEYLAQSEENEKVLVFCNARARVDDLADRLATRLRPLKYSVRAHHGSLSQSVREESEKAIKVDERVVLVSTSTLEIGIDIGDIDLVVLADPPPDVPSLLQRVGRGNRRSDHTRVMLSADGPRDELIQISLLAAAEEGWLGEDRPGPQFAVARQQIASYIYQGPRRSRPRRYVELFCDALLPSGYGRAIVERMIIEQELIADEAGVRLGPELLELCERGSIHSTIEDPGGASVVEASTGREIAHGIEYRGGRGLRIGGYKLDVKSASLYQIEVDKASGATEGAWNYAVRPMFLGAGRPEAVRRFLGLEVHQWPVLSLNGTHHIFHFGGARRNAVLDLLRAAAPGADDLRVDEWLIRTAVRLDSVQAWLRSAYGPRLEVELAQQLERLERILARPAANRQLPVEVRLHEVRAWLRLTEDCALFKFVELVPATGAMAAALQILAGPQNRLST